MIEQRPTLMKNNVRLRILGRRRPIADDVLAEMDKTVGITANNTGLTLALAINYGARQEIIDATRAIVDELLDPKKREATLRDRNVVSVEELIDERFFASKLYDPDAIDPDLFIRTGGEKRLSNYLLWQLSYAELWFTDVLWPDFTRNDLKEAIIWFQSRQRRFGDVVSR
jgi:undecaprenyl diphosphate synthase